MDSFTHNTATESNRQVRRLGRRWVVCALPIAWIIIVLGGCAKWSHLTDEVKKPEKGLPSPQMSPDSVAVDTVFIRLDENAEPELGLAWGAVNEQAIDIAIRRKLDANGIRAGVIMGELPMSVQKWVDLSSKRMKEDVTEQADIAAEVTSHIQHLQCRAGRRKELVIRARREGNLTLLHNDGLAKGKTYDNPALFLELKMYPNPDGTANLHLMPEVQYGEQKPNFISKEQAWLREFRYPTEQWKEAMIECRLVPGQILMVSGTERPIGLGEHFFWTETAQQKKQRIVLLIRLAKTQLDDLFAPEKTADSLRAMESDRVSVSP